MQAQVIPLEANGQNKADLCCLESGATIFKGLDVDLFLTGELSHHDTLGAVERGKCVIARKSILLVTLASLSKP